MNIHEIYVVGAECLAEVSTQCEKHLVKTIVRWPEFVEFDSDVDIAPRMICSSSIRSEENRKLDWIVPKNRLKRFERERMTDIGCLSGFYYR
jgi:hypothetical protein